MLRRGDGQRVPRPCVPYNRQSPSPSEYVNLCCTQNPKKASGSRKTAEMEQSTHRMEHGHSGNEASTAAEASRVYPIARMLQSLSCSASNAHPTGRADSLELYALAEGQSSIGWFCVSVLRSETVMSQQPCLFLRAHELSDMLTAPPAG